MHDTQLHLGLRVQVLDRLREALQPVDARDQDVAHAEVLELGQHVEPELGTLGLADPQAQQVLLALEFDAERDVDRGVKRDHLVVEAREPAPNSPLRSRGTSISSSPEPVSTFFPVAPFLELPVPRPSGACFS